MWTLKEQVCYYYYLKASLAESRLAEPRRRPHLEARTVVGLLEEAVAVAVAAPEADVPADPDGAVGVDAELCAGPADDSSVC